LPDLTGRRAIVTGAARGIGAATAARLAADGAHVLLVDVGEAVRETAAALNQPALVEDVAAPGAGLRIADAARAALGGCDILVNNAGIGGSKPLPDSDDALIARFLDVNLAAVLRVTRDVLPLLPRPGGRIVSVSSVFGVGAHPGTTAYAVAKAGVAQFTREQAGWLGPEGITVNAVAPGVIATAMTAPYRDIAYYNRAVLDPTPLRRAGRPEEVAAVIAFLASDEAAYVSGQVIGVDGGWLAARHPPRPNEEGGAKWT
jgi:NAD(P)-dependent dehydrogenase (short-subunit alcohol dehydrogenase family)